MSHRASHWAVEQRVGDPTAKLLLLTLAEGADIDTCETWPSIRTLSRRVEASEKTVKRKLAQLARLGLIDIENRERPGGGSSSNKYTLRLPQERGEGVKLTPGGGGQSCDPPGGDRAVTPGGGQSCDPPFRRVIEKVRSKGSSVASAPEQFDLPETEPVEPEAASEIRLGGHKAASEAPSAVETPPGGQSDALAPKRAKAGRSRKEADPAEGKRAADIIAVWCEEYRDTYGETYRVSGKDASAARRIGRAMAPEEFRPYLAEVWSAPTTAFNCCRRSSTLSDLDSAWMAIRHELRGLGKIATEPSVGGVFQIGGAK